MEQRDYSSNDAETHFLKNIRQMKNNAVLMEEVSGGKLEPVFISDDFAKMMECTPQEAKDMLTGVGFYKTTVPEDRPLVRSMFERKVAYDGGSVLTIQKVTKKKNKIWCNVNYAFISDFGKNYVYCTYTDVTALKEHEERLRSTYRGLGESFYQIDEKTLAILRVNLTKNEIEEAKGKDLYESDSISYSYQDSIRLRTENFPIASERKALLKEFDKDKLIDEYLLGNANIQRIFYSVRKDKRACFVNLKASMTRHPLTGDIVAFITEKECNSKKVNDTLTNKILAEQFDMVSYLVNGEYGVTIGDASKIKYGSIFPTSLNGNYDNYLSSQVAPVLSGDDKEVEETLKALSLETVSREIKKSEPYVVNIAVEMEGETYYKQLDYYSVDPEADFYILLKSDTTEIQKEHLALNEQLKNALDAANQANVAKTAFLSNMSHEIRTPMNAIIGLQSIALKEEGLPDSTREHLEKIGGSARHLLSLINDILDMSRIESGRMTVNNTEFSFAEMLDQINTMINSQCSDKGLTYECRIEGKVDDYYFGDDMKLKQVLINILGNSVKFTDAPGTVSFIVLKAAEFEGQSTLRFTMKDTGIGMDKEYLPKIFDAFSKEDETSTNKYGSTGLGMAITKNIVELMNGEIKVESEKGVGTTFTVSVTLKNSDRKGHEEVDVRPQDLHVLIVDDDPIALMHAKNIFEEIGIAFDTAEGGQEAIDIVKLKHARHESYNLIFVDWKMPKKDGVEVTKEIREVIGNETAVIVLTAYNWDDIEEEAIKAGVDSFMSKPLFASNVLTAFQKAMSNKKTRKEEEKVVDLTGRKILLAEDMMINAEIMKQLLSMMNMEVFHAENGQIAVDMFNESEEGFYDAVLMDVRMPVLDGLGATKGIRALDRKDAKEVPIIAMTANAFDEDVQRSLQAGMNAHLSKPVEPDRLYATLFELIRD